MAQPRLQWGQIEIRYKWSGHHTVWFILYVANTGFLPIGDDFEVNFKWLESIKILIFYQIIIMIFNEYIKLILWFISESWFEPIIHSKLRIFAEIFNFGPISVIIESKTVRLSQFWDHFGHCPHCFYDDTNACHDRRHSGIILPYGNRLYSEWTTLIYRNPLCAR